MRELAFGNQQLNEENGADNSHLVRCKGIEGWALDTYNFACRQWGEENIASFIVHLDELNPHVHCTVIPVAEVKKKQRISFKKVFHGTNKSTMREYLLHLHDVFSKVNAKWGLERGEDIHVTGAKHRSTEQYRADLRRECESLEEQIDANKQYIRQLQVEVKHAETRVKGLYTMITNLEYQKEDLEKEIQKISVDLKANKGNSEELQRKIERLNANHQQVVNALSDKREKLVMANRQLNEIQQKEAEAREQLSEVRAEANEQKQRSAGFKQEVREASSDLAQQVRFRVYEGLADMLLPELSAHSAMFCDSQNSLLQDFAQRGNDIVKCASYLFAGYVNGATQLAQSHGGGGSSPDTGWGRRDDEDDLRWARRCIFQATKMMKPAGKIGLRR